MNQSSVFCPSHLVHEYRGAGVEEGMAESKGHEQVIKQQMTSSPVCGNWGYETEGISCISYILPDLSPHVKPAEQVTGTFTGKCLEVPGLSWKSRTAMVPRVALAKMRFIKLHLLVDILHIQLEDISEIFSLVVLFQINSRYKILRPTLHTGADPGLLGH